MTKNLLKKLTLNAFDELNNRLSLDGCNDLEKDDPLLKGISENEFQLIEKEWIKKFSAQAREINGKMNFNSDVVNLLIKNYE